MAVDDEIRESLLKQSREWLRMVIDSTGLTANALAKKANVSASNLHKLLYNPDFTHPMSEAQKIKISRATGIDLPGGNAVPALSRGFNEPEVMPYRGPTGIPSQRSDENGRDIWTINTDMLDIEGYLRGDHVQTDLNVTPRRGDIVVAQIYGDKGTAKTVFRKYDPPYLIASTTHREEAPKPVVVDNERATIMGVVIRSWRERLETHRAAG